MAKGVSNFISRNKIVLIYGLGLASILLLMKWLEWRFLIIDHSFEVFTGAIALLFTLLGVWLTLKLARPKKETLIVEKEVFRERPINGQVPDEGALQRFGISRREWEVLALIAEGLSNREIADRLYVSLNTVKTHTSNLYLKLDARRRTQALEIAKKAGLLA